MVRLLHVGLGPLGRMLLSDFFARRQGELVAVVDSNPELAGREVSQLVAGAPADLRVLASIDDVRGYDGVDSATVTTSSDLDACMDTFRVLLKQRLNVVSSCEELLYPWLRHPIHTAELHERAVRGRSRLIGTGVNPGFLMDTLPLALTAVCNGVNSVEAWRIQDATTRRVPFQRKIGAGLHAAEFAAAASAGTLRHVGLGESLHFLAHYLGFELERWEEELEPVLAECDLECGLGPIPAGHATGVRQVATGWNADVPVVRLTFQAAIGQDDPHDRVRVEGNPPLDVQLRGGVHGDVATTAMLLNVLDVLESTEPGLHTMATIPPARHKRRS